MVTKNSGDKWDTYIQITYNSTSHSGVRWHTLLHQTYWDISRVPIIQNPGCWWCYCPQLRRDNRL